MAMQLKTALWGYLVFLWCYMDLLGRVPKGKAAISRGRCERVALAIAPQLVLPAATEYMVRCTYPAGVVVGVVDDVDVHHVPLPPSQGNHAAKGGKEGNHCQRDARTYERRALEAG
ncbi:hypothetical protein CGRA01v4_07362 [Colletotrichum graminicola]|nr:hypothetical protein CGRA01v4_07362 [Colletotrichum graminicola]